MRIRCSSDCLDEDAIFADVPYERHVSAFPVLRLFLSTTGVVVPCDMSITSDEYKHSHLLCLLFIRREEVDA